MQINKDVQERLESDFLCFNLINIFDFYLISDSSG